MTTQSSDVGHGSGQAAPVPTMTVPPAGPPGAPDAAAVMAKAGAENFTVASRLLPAARRRDLLAIYGFARLVDALGDESLLDRAAALDWLDAELIRAASGRASHPLLVQLTPTLRARRLP